MNPRSNSEEPNTESLLCKFQRPSRLKFTYGDSTGENGVCIYVSGISWCPVLLLGEGN